MGICSSSDDTDDDDNEVIPAWIHVPWTIITIAVFIWAIQQFCGAPTDKIKVFRYRALVCANAFITTIIAISFNVNLSQESEESTDSACNSSYCSLAKFIRTMTVLNVSLMLVLGYWFLVDAVRAAYKATRGINDVQPPSWIQKFWLVFICIEITALTLCYIFAFATESSYFLVIAFLLIYIAAVFGSIIILGAVIAVQTNINRALRNRRNNGGNGQAAERDVEATNQLQNAFRTLRIMLCIGVVFVSGSLFLTGITLNYLTCNAYNPNVLSLGSSIMDTILEYMIYMTLINGFNLILVFWTYRASNFNYFCYCWSFRKYTSRDYRDTDINTHTVCYKCFPHMIENAEAKRLDIIHNPQQDEQEAESESTNQNV